jgi:hypothetical protein
LQKISGGQRTAIVAEAGNPLIQVVNVTWIAQWKAGEQLQVPKILGTLKLLQQLEVSQRAHTLIVPSGIVIDEMLFEAEK